MHHGPKREPEGGGPRPLPPQPAQNSAATPSYFSQDPADHRSELANPFLPSQPSLGVSELLPERRMHEYRR